MGIFFCSCWCLPAASSRDHLPQNLWEPGLGEHLVCVLSAQVRMSFRTALCCSASSACVIIRSRWFRRYYWDSLGAICGLTAFTALCVSGVTSACSGEVWFLAYSGDCCVTVATACLLRRRGGTGSHFLRQWIEWGSSWPVYLGPLRRAVLNRTHSRASVC